MKKSIYIIRHGQSFGNINKSIGGWMDFQLTDMGIEQAHKCAQFFKTSGITFDYCFSSVLTRATHTRDVILSDLGLKIPIEENWRLNESHEGSFTGTNLEEIRSNGKLIAFRRFINEYSYMLPPLSEDSPLNPKNDPKYADLPDKDDLPLSESNEMMEHRFRVFWNDKLIPLLQESQYSNILLVCHGNIIKIIMKVAEGLDWENTVLANKISFPNCACLKYDYDGDRFSNKQIIGNDEYMKKYNQASNQLKKEKIDN